MDGSSALHPQQREEEGKLRARGGGSGWGKPHFLSFWCWVVQPAGFLRSKNTK